MRKAVVAKRKCATKVGGGGFVRHSLLHEGSRECDTRGAEYGLAPRRISKRGRSIHTSQPARTLRRRAAKSAVTYAKRGSQSGFKKMLSKTVYLHTWFFSFLAQQLLLVVFAEHTAVNRENLAIVADFLLCVHIFMCWVFSFVLFVDGIDKTSLLFERAVQCVVCAVCLWVRF